MGDTRDPETDQPAPKPGGFPVQAVLIEALKQRMEFGLRKYGRPLETHNGRDPLRDMWEEMLDMVSYFTQYILEQGVELPGLEKFAKKFVPEPEPRGGATWRGPRADLFILDEAVGSLSEGDGLTGGSPLIPSACTLCRHEPHMPGMCRADAPGGLTNCMCGVP
ncbi:MAG TPA: hypothetical protein VFN03_05675 [Trueperaceae bacterium]|nr:hypothetical protein [Trueperaceae bacterium]